MLLGSARKIGGIVLTVLAIASLTFGQTSPLLPTHHLLIATKTPAANQQAVPDAASQRNALVLIQNVFKADYADISPHGRGLLAKNLLQQGLKTSDDPAGKFMLLMQAADASIPAGESTILTQAIDALGQDFAVDAVAMKSRAYGLMISSCWTSIQAKQLANGCETAIDQAIAADKYDDALQLQSIGQGAANRTGQMDLSRRFQLLRPELINIRQQYAQAKSALDRLQAHPDDARACTIAGKFLCCVKSDWSAGLPVLAHADDAQLAGAAKADLSAGNDSKSVARSADDWWIISVKLPELERQHVQTYAVAEYRRVLPAVDGLSRTVAARRIADFDAAVLQQMHLVPGLFASLFEDKDFSQSNSTQVDTQINFEWSHQPPAPSMPKEDYSIRWIGKLQIAQPGLYTLVLQANEGAKLQLDGKTILETATGTHRHTTQKIDLKLDAGVHDFNLDYWAGTGMAKCKLLWIAPGSLALVPIPADAFYHDADETAESN